MGLQACVAAAAAQLPPPWPPLFWATGGRPTAFTAHSWQAGDAVPDVKLDELVGGEIKQRSLAEVFAGKKVCAGMGACGHEC